jgi:hypothetical protein
MAAFALAACGDSDDSAQSLSFELSGDGKAAKFSGPASAESGEAEITFTNETKDEAEMQLIRVDDGYGADDVIKGLEAATQGKPFPEWFYAGGGVPSTKPGETKTVTQVLEPGTYYTTDVENDIPDPKSMVAIKVTGDVSDEELEADASVQAAEYTFEDEGLTAGENQIAFENVGAQPHHLIVAPIKGDATIEEVEKAFASKKGGEPPLEEKGIQTATSVIEGGESQLVDVNLKPGRYAFLCFISDRQGGPPHVTKGMVKEVEIE